MKSISIALSCLAFGIGIVRADDKPEPVRVAAAVSMREALSSASQQYEKDSGKHIELTYGSSGQLLAQIRSGADVDLFISAAHEQTDTLENEKLVTPNSRQVIAQNTLVLIVPKDSKLELKEFKDLARPEVQRIAIGEPSTVPAGAYAKQTLESLKIYGQIEKRLVLGTNVRQVLDYVTRGEVSAGVVYATDARQAEKDVRVVATAEASWHKPIEYPAVILGGANHGTDAEEFLIFLTGETGRKTFASFGFLLPPERDRNEPKSPADATDQKP